MVMLHHGKTKTRVIQFCTFSLLIFWSQCSISVNSLALYLCGLRVFELLGFVNIQEKVLQQAFSLTQLDWNLSLMLEREVFLFIFSILLKADNSERDVQWKRPKCIGLCVPFSVFSPPLAALQTGGCLSPPGRHFFASGRSERPSCLPGSCGGGEEWCQMKSPAQIGSLLNNCGFNFSLHIFNRQSAGMSKDFTCTLLMGSVLKIH